VILASERARIDAVAARHGIDSRLLVALRQTENGGPGREFGIMDGATTWDDQADHAARTIRHTIGRFARAVGAFDWWDDEGGRYTDRFLTYFSRGGPGYDGYAPVKNPPVENDPTNLNVNHLRNLTVYYQAECAV
jgi:hypothetical protein